MSDERRQRQRADVRRLETVHVYRDRKDVTASEMARRLDEQADTYTLFNVVALLRDVSHSGLGLEIRGQQIMADNLLQSGERYMLRLPIGADPPDALKPACKPEGGGVFSLLVKVQCRWHKRDGKQASAGFELVGENVAAIVAFLDRRFETGLASDDA